MYSSKLGLFSSQTTQQNIQNLRNKAGFARTTAIKNNKPENFSHPPSQNPKKNIQMAETTSPNQPTHSAARNFGLEEVKALEQRFAELQADLSTKDG